MDPVSTAVEETRSLDTRSHRPRPVPERPWTTGQTWVDLLFAYRHVGAQALRLHFSRRQDVVVWSTEAVGAGR